ncbi:MAG: hypothetical protein ABR581_03085 [Thermoleophilaceae bacterium]
MRGTLIASAAAAVAAFCAAAAPASADNGRLADFKLGLTSRSPGSPTGMTLHVLFHRAGDRDAKPSALRSAVVHGPRGLRYDTTTVRQCTASDEQIRLLGSKACPDDSELTVGSFSAMTGFGPPIDPMTGDNHVFDGPNQLIEIITAPGTPLSPAFDRLTISGSTTTAHPPMAPGGPPDGQTAVRSLDFSIPVRVAGARSLITTPPGCPVSGRWTSVATFGFADGSSDTVASTTPCERVTERGGAGRPRLRLAVRPRRVRAGHRARLRVRVRSSSRRCVSHARVRLGRRSVRTDRHGRATLRARFRRAGSRRLRATRSGCRPARAHLRVLSAR